MTTIVFDLEIYQSIGSEVDGEKLTFDQTDKLGVSVLTAWESATDCFSVHGGDDMAPVKKLLKEADNVVSFNGTNFDLPVLLGASKADWRQNPLNFVDEDTLAKVRRGDVLRNIYRSLNVDPDRYNPVTHAGWGLGVVALNTLGVAKDDDGHSMPRLWREGHWCRVTNHCLTDTALTRDLWRFALANGYLLGKEGRKLKIPRRLFEE